MILRKPIKFVTALVSALVVGMGSTGIMTAETVGSDVSVQTDITEADTSAAEATEEETEAKDIENETDWEKAKITEYDSSLSLISYELIPERENDSQAGAESDGTGDGGDGGEEETVEPTPVEEYKTGTEAGNIPVPEAAPEPESKQGEFTFITNGWGHCVGMSQNGANYYARYSGWTYQDILFHYYPGTTLMNTGTAETEKVTVDGVEGDVLSMVSGIVYREISDSMDIEAIKAQAVAVYTYIKYHGNDARDLRCKADPPENVVNACRSVLGEALYYNGNFAFTVFSASTAGATANCYDIFSNNIPYLVSVPSEYDALYDPNYGSVAYISAEDVRNLVEKRYNITLSDDPENWFQLTYGDGGYVSSVLLDGQKNIRGYDLKICLGLKSSNFRVSYGGDEEE